MADGRQEQTIALKGARVLLTGATGMVGRRLLERLAAGGATVATLGRRSPPGKGSSHFTWDASKSVIPPAASDWGAAAIVHAAAMTDVDACEEHPALAQQINAAATGDLATMAARVGARFLYLSTAGVFDGRRGDYSEDDTPNPLNVYARTKLEGEREALRIGGSLVVRFNVIGPEHLTSWILSSAVRGEPIDVYTDVLFNPVEAGDLARMVCSLCESRLAGKCHIGSDETISKAEYAERLVAHAGLQHRARLTRCRLAESPPRALRPLNTSLRIADHVRLVAAPPSLDAAIRRLATGTTANEPSPRGMP